jgi:diguanylate cyclase (GGDEF)-like protein/PAS domain S-box-containing protein
MADSTRRLKVLLALVCAGLLAFGWTGIALHLQSLPDSAGAGQGAQRAAYVGVAALFSALVAALGLLVARRLDRDRVLERERSEHEARLGSLIRLSFDIYWEQDPDLRYTRCDGLTMLRPEQFIGRKRWEVPGVLATPDDWQRHKAQLAAREPFRDFVVRFVNPDGTSRYISITGEPVFGEAGEFKGYRGTARNVTASMRREEALRESNERFNILARGTHDVIRDHDLLADRMWWNEHIETRLGYDRNSLPPGGDAWLQRIHPADQGAVEGAYRALIGSDATTWLKEYRFRRGDGGYIYVIDRGFVVRDESGRATRMLGAMSDITARKEAEQRIRARELQQSVIARFGQIALATRDLGELMREAVGLVARTLETEYCSLIQVSPDRSSLILRAGEGLSSEWIGRNVAAASSNTPGAAAIRSRESVVVEDIEQDRRFVRSEFVIAHGIRSSLSVPISSQDGVFGVLGVHARETRRFSIEHANFLQSIANTLAAATERSRAEERLTRLAQFDTLTGLPNRVLFRDRLEQMLLQGRRNGWGVGVMFIDLDRFKVVNDTLGHDIGDLLLAHVGTRLAGSTRAGDTVGRLSGDEFAVALTGLARPDDAGVVAQKAIDALAEPFEVGGHRAYVTASIGIAVYPSDGADADTLLRNSDTAMYRVKSRGRNGYQFYMPEMNARALERLELETDLRGALERGEFLLHYQPKIQLRSGRIVGFEALLRWLHPARGLIPPEEFVPLLEDTGLVLPIGEWVLRDVCRQIRLWRADSIEVPPIAVNLSARQFQMPDLDRSIRGILYEQTIDPGLLHLEITESLLMQDTEAAVRTLRALKEFGIGISVDDFGTGYSSLSYLRRFPLDALKIDRSFIDDIVAHGDDAAITRAIISMAHNLKLGVVAEGVETREQLDFLAAHDCDFAQGFLFSEPLPAAECESMLRCDSRLSAAFDKAGSDLFRGH